LENSKEKGILNTGHFYDSLVLLTLVRSTSARRQGGSKKPVFYFYTLSLGTLWIKGENLHCLSSFLLVIVLTLGDALA
jgi:hypothetical protein